MALESKWIVEIILRNIKAALYKPLLSLQELFKQTYKMDASVIKMDVAYICICIVVFKTKPGLGYR